MGEWKGDDEQRPYLAGCHSVHCADAISCFGPRGVCLFRVRCSPSIGPSLSVSSPTNASVDKSLIVIMIIRTLQCSSHQWGFEDRLSSISTTQEVHAK